MENKVYLITGASSDIGLTFIKCLEKQFVAEGKKAVVFAHYAFHAERLLKLQSEVQALEVIPVQADLSKAEDIKRLVEAVQRQGNCPDYMIHLPAAKLAYNRIKQFSAESLEQDMAIQVESLGALAQAFLPAMAKRKSGKVVVMLSSVTLGMPPKFMSRYVTVKYALLGLMKSLAAEYADKGVNINGISPNMMETQFLEQIDEKIVEMNRENCAMKRNVKVEETVAAIQFLLSNGAGYMNGVNLNLSGGDK
ncbi:MAG: SDR family oxidoreductase [Lachnospiraceae bacterium]|nr:SDR family oxidoreductase [Lachnospiraceae bacterium]